MADAVVKIGADLSELRRELAKLPNLSGDAAQQTLIQLEKAVSKAEASAKKSAKQVAKAQEQAAKEAAAAAKRHSEALKDVGDTAGDTESSIRAVSGALGMLSPEAEGALNVVAELAGGFEGLTKGTGLLGGSLGSLGAALGVAAVAVAGAATAYAVIANEMDRAADEGGRLADRVDETRSRAEDAAVEVRGLWDEWEKFNKDAQKWRDQLDLINGAISETEVKARDAAQALKDAAHETLRASGQQVAALEASIAANQEYLESGEATFEEEVRLRKELGQQQKALKVAEAALRDKKKALEESVEASKLAIEYEEERDKSNEFIAERDRKRAEAAQKSARAKADADREEAAAARAKADADRDSAAATRERERAEEAAAAAFESAQGRLVAISDQAYKSQLEGIDKVEQARIDELNAIEEIVMKHPELEEVAAAARVEVNRAAQAEIQKIQKDEADDAKRRIAEIVDAYVNAYAQISSAVGAFAQIAIDARAQEVEAADASIAEAQEKAAALQEAAENLSSAEQEIAKKKGDALVAQAEAERDEIAAIAQEQAIKAFRVQQAAGISSAIISGASAAIAALAPPPVGAGPILGPALAIAIGATTAASVATIAAEQPPAFDIGGMVGAGGLIGSQTPDQVLIRALPGERVQSREEAAGAGRPQELVIVNQYKHRVFNAFVKDNLNLPGSPLNSAFRGTTRVGQR